MGPRGWLGRRSGTRAISWRPRRPRGLTRTSEEPPMTAASSTHSEAHGHEHRDVSGGGLRPSVFGAMDGLVPNVSLIAGGGGGGVSPHTAVVTRVAGLAAGALSLATGEAVSDSMRDELVRAN